MKNKLIKSTIILMIGGIITKVLGMIIRVTMSRLMGSQGIGLYMMILPTFILFIGLAQFGFPVAISKLVSEGKNSNKNLLLSIIPISLLINLFIIIILIISSSFIANNLIHQPILKNSIICIGFVLPFTSISSIVRGYFFGKQKMIPHVLSNICEDLVRLVIILIGIPIFINKGIEYATCFLVISNIISELTSTIILLLFLPKNFSIKSRDIKPDKGTIKSIFNISIPTTGTRIIGSIGYFIEPIILTTALLKCGYSNEFIVEEYGIINGFVLPLILLPSFFTSAISSALLPILSNSNSNKDYKNMRLKVNQGIFFCLIIGIPFTLFILLYPDILLKILYKTDKGIHYIRVLAPICLLHYIQSVLTTYLQAIGDAKGAMYGTLVGIIIRSVSLALFSRLKIGIYGLIIATSLNIIYVTGQHIIKVRKHIKNHPI